MTVPNVTDAPAAPSQVLRVAIVDDDPFVLQALRAYLSSDERIEVTSTFSRAADALAFLHKIRVDVLLTDVRMPEMDGLELLTRVRRQWPRTAVVVLTSFDDDEAMVAALAQHANGFLLKDADPQSLVDAVRTVHEGQSLLSPQVLARLVARMPRTTSTGTSRSTWAGEVEALTPRQREVLLLIARGLSNTEIEVELGITRATCRSHITALLARLGARDRAQLVIAAYEAGLISPR